VSDTLVVDKVKEELLRHRKSMWNALQQSRDEVECLQKQCAINTEIIAQHDDDIAEMRKKEKAWQQRCLIAEVKLQNISEENDSLRCHKRLLFPQSKQSAESRNDEAALLRKSEQRKLQKSSDESKQSVEDQNDEEKLPEISEQTVSSRYHKIISFPQSGLSWIGRNDNQNKLELALKISSRNEAISSLEQTIQYLQAEMQNLVVTQRMKVKKIYDSHAKKEDDFKGQVKSLRKELLRLLRKNSRIAANERVRDI